MNFTKDELVTAIVEGIQAGKAKLGWCEDAVCVSVELNGEQVDVRSDDVCSRYHFYNADDHEYAEYFFREITNWYFDVEGENEGADKPVEFSEDDESRILDVINNHTPTSYYYDDGREADGYLGSELVFYT